MSSKKDKPLISSEDENMDAELACGFMDAELARGLTKHNFKKICDDIYSQIIGEITHSAKCGSSVCIVPFFADENILAWLDEKLKDKGFDIEWDCDINNPLKIEYTVKW